MALSLLRRMLLILLLLHVLRLGSHINSWLLLQSHDLLSLNLILLTLITAAHVVE